MESRSEFVLRQLRERILAGEIAAETHLEEIPLAQALNVSRTPVRAALAQLAQEGLLDYARKRGYVVRKFGLEDIAAAYDVRASLEGMACRLVAEHGLPTEDYRTLVECVRTGDRILSKGRLDPADFELYRAANVTLHETILAAAGNQLLSNFVHQTYNMPITSDRVMFWTDFKVIEHSHEDHRRIVEAIGERNSWRAEALMREHIYASGRFVVSQYRDKRAPASQAETADVTAQKSGAPDTEHDEDKSNNAAHLPPDALRGFAP